MSLDLYLYYGSTEHTCTCDRCGNVHISMEEEEAYSTNITHNLARMAYAAGIYEILWRPEEVPVTCARDMVEPLRAGIERMEADPGHFKTFDAPNGWGTYEQLIPWLRRVLQACEESPDALVRASR